MTDGIDYTIAAIPTTYCGRRYRSRLEARWAAFFDLLGLRAEYEPYELGKWSPDFLLPGPGCGDLLVEVKPITSFHAETAARMGRACVERGLMDHASPMLVGVSPWIVNDVMFVGWAGYKTNRASDGLEWSEVAIAWGFAGDSPDVELDLWQQDPPYPSDDGRPSGTWNGLLNGSSAWGLDHQTRTYPRYCEDLWSQAANAVQWQGPGK